VYLSSSNSVTSDDAEYAEELEDVCERNGLSAARVVGRVKRVELRAPRFALQSFDSEALHLTLLSWNEIYPIVVSVSK